MSNTFQLLAVIKASIKASGNCAVPFFALREIFPVIRDEDMETGKLPKNICDRIRTLCNTEHLICRYDDHRKVVIFKDARWSASPYTGNYSEHFAETVRAGSA